LGYLVNKSCSAAKLCIKIRFHNENSAKKLFFAHMFIYFYMNFFHNSIILLILPLKSET